MEHGMRYMMAIDGELVKVIDNDYEYTGMFILDR